MNLIENKFNFIPSTFSTMVCPGCLVSSTFGTPLQQIYQLFWCALQMEVFQQQHLQRETWKNEICEIENLLRFPSKWKIAWSIHHGREKMIHCHSWQCKRFKSNITKEILFSKSLPAKKRKDERKERPPRDPAGGHHMVLQ